MMQWIQINKNPRNRRTTDCVTRAFCEAFGQSYEDTLREMCEYAIKTGYYINDKKFIERFLEDKGWQKMKQPKHPDGSLFMLKDLEEQDTLVMLRPSHITYVNKDGDLEDTWDCRCRYIRNYYIRKEVN